MLPLQHTLTASYALTLLAVYTNDTYLTRDILHSTGSCLVNPSDVRDKPFLFSMCLYRVRQLLISVYSAATLLPMQSTVLATAIPSVGMSFCLSHAGTPSRWMKTGSCSFQCEVAKSLYSFLIPTMVGGDVAFHLKFVLKLAQPDLKSADFDQYMLITCEQ